ncbi:hypothetical protein GPUN_2851 [Glaciecola punicea ACAM 611]|uniref:DUF547 domain-containing protein n=1 Tax=Glaciecola punicea ACAM 611 TaxID=1121923 RepID=H5TF38_9ALTE|nr:DUF547 domain-containing protein [Glaciecola punicea]GAB56965.1 hypothetical protein GPUN_2851 [Glaciecola punicea ACAM 611]
MRIFMPVWVKRYVAATVVLLAMLAFSAQTKTLHDDWSTLLAEHVSPTAQSHNTVVDYTGFLAQRSALKNYLNALEQVTQAEFAAWDDAKQLAFLLNAYNAWTVELILTEYPNLDSIKDLGSFFRSPWKKSFIPLLGKVLSLDDIEHDLIRGDNKYQEPRIHFAVNCASIGCPALREEAYEASKLDMQLEQQTLRFLSDRSRNNMQGEALNLSSIFKWYKNDFELGFRSANSLESFVLLYADTLGLSPEQRALLQSEQVKTDYLDYDWQLNDVKR